MKSNQRNRRKRLPYKRPFSPSYRRHSRSVFGRYKNVPSFRYLGDRQDDGTNLVKTSDATPEIYIEPVIGHVITEVRILRDVVDGGDLVLVLNAGLYELPAPQTPLLPNVYVIQITGTIDGEAKVQRSQLTIIVTSIAKLNRNGTAKLNRNGSGKLLRKTA